MIEIKRNEMTAVEFKIKQILIEFGHKLSEINEESFQEKLSEMERYDIFQAIINEENFTKCYWCMILPYFELDPVRKDFNHDEN